MRKKIVLVLLLSLSQIVFSQPLTDSLLSNINKLSESGEEIVLETDRQLYCVDERIYFTATYRFKYPMESLQWSKVIYVELIRWNGEKIAQAKFKLHKNSASGYLTIPRTVQSGNYYVRAYTKWMRNFPVQDYAYGTVKIINPFESEIDHAPDQNHESKLVHTIPLRGNLHSGIECFTNKSAYKQREKVELTIQLKSHEIQHANFCISVAKVADIDTSNIFIQMADEASADEKSKVYLPEYRGTSVSGKILNSDKPSSTANATLHFSIPQNWKYFTTFQTNEMGLFYFTLPDFYGQYDFYIDAVLKNGEDADIMVDSDYCNRSIYLEYLPFFLDSIEKSIALEMTVNMQISGIYHEKSEVDTTELSDIAFYGKPKHVYYTKEYIQLPNLEEFIFELVKEVRTVRTKNEASLKLLAYSPYRNMKPLILLDNIPVININELLKTPLSRIEKVEIIEDPYIVSGKTYSGLICVSTNKNYSGGIKPNKNSLFIAYNLLSDGHSNMPDYSSRSTPYRQNLLFWNTDLKLVENHPQTLSFNASDGKGEYIVYIRSIGDKRKAQLYGSCKILVE